MIIGIDLGTTNSLACYFDEGETKIIPNRLGENLLVEGWDLKTIPVGTKFRCNDVLLEITQIGKECHHGCEIFQKMGDCIMPRNGILARVLEGGKIKPGDQIEIVE